MNKTAEETKMEAGKISLSPDDFLYGIIAALRVNGHERIVANRRDFHHAFYGILKKLNDPEFTDAIMVDTSEIDFDPLYGLSEWLVDALGRARRDFLVNFRDANIIEVSVGRKESEGILSMVGSEKYLLKLADLFCRGIAVLQ